MKPAFRRSLSLLLALILTAAPLSAAADGLAQETEEPEVIEEMIEASEPAETEPETVETEPTEEPAVEEEEQPEEDVPEETVSGEPENEETVECGELPDAEAMASLIDSGICGANLRWELDVSGVLTISGRGAMENYDWDNLAPWYDYRWNVTEIVVKSGVTTISAFAFEGCAAWSVTLSDTLVSIDQNAFVSCSNLSSIFIPASVENIEALAFQGCSSLTEITVDSRSRYFTSVDGILYTANKKELAIVPEGRTDTEFHIAEGVETVWDFAFKTNKLRTLYLPASLRFFTPSCFNDCRNLTDVYVDAGNQNYMSIDGVVYDKDETTLVFYPADHTLQTYVIPAGISKIGWDAMYSIQTERVILPDSMSFIDGYSISWSDLVKEIVFTGSVPEFQKAFNEPWCFSGITATAYYPGDDASWTEAARANAGGNLTWVPKPKAELQKLYLESISTKPFALEQEYLTLRKGETAQLLPISDYRAMHNIISWSVDSGNNVLKVDSSGTITALRAGTTTVYATIAMGGNFYTTTCRVDVTDKTTVAEVMVNGVSLPETKATVNLFSTEYTRIPVVLNLTQNMSIYSENDALENTGHGISSARFADYTAAVYFGLRVADDRTLEIVPTEYAMNNPGAVKNMKSGIVVNVGGMEFYTQPLSLTVKKTLPTIKAAAVKINYFESRRAAMTFTGGNVLEVNIAPGTGNIPAGFGFEGFDLIYYGTAIKASGKLKLMATVEGVAVPVPVTVSVSASWTEPTVKLSASSITLMAGTSDKAEVTVKQGDPVDVVFEDADKMRVNFFNWELEDGKLTIYAPNLSAAGGTYKCYVSVPGSSKRAALTVKVGYPNPTMTLKASGSIDSAVANSPVTITPKIAGYHVGSGEKYTVKVIQSGTNRDVTPLFSVKQDGAVLKVTAAGSIPQGYTYNAQVVASLNNGGTVRCEKTVKLSVKWSDPVKMTPSVSLKASGSIDVIRPATSIKLTPTFKNWFGANLTASNLVFYENKVPVNGAAPFNVTVEDGAFVLTNRSASYSSKYTVAFQGVVNGRVVTSKPIALSVKCGTIKVVQSTKSVTLLRSDRFDSQIVEIDLPDDIDGVNTFGYIQPSPMTYTVERLYRSSNKLTLRISFNNSIPAPKGITMKFNLYLKGGDLYKSNGSFSVKINLK